MTNDLDWFAALDGVMPGHHDDITPASARQYIQDLHVALGAIVIAAGGTIDVKDAHLVAASRTTPIITIYDHPRRVTVSTAPDYSIEAVVASTPRAPRTCPHCGAPTVINKIEVGSASTASTTSVTVDGRWDCTAACYENDPDGFADSMRRHR